MSLFVYLSYYGSYGYGRLALTILFAMVAGAIYLYRRRRLKQSSNTEKARISALKQQGLKIAVDLTKCEIKLAEYVEAINNVRTIEGATGYLLQGMPYEKAQEDIIHAQCVLVFNWKNPADNVEYKFVSSTIDKNSVTLSFYLDKYKTTSVYFDPGSHDYYFDLSFLESGL